MPDCVPQADEEELSNRDIKNTCSFFSTGCHQVCRATAMLSLKDSLKPAYHSVLFTYTINHCTCEKPDNQPSLRQNLFLLRRCR